MFAIWKSLFLFLPMTLRACSSCEESSEDAHEGTCSKC